MKRKIDIGSFYITNVCNLTCNNCASFNNLRFKGHFEWADSEQRIKRWADILEIEEISILGGEPFCHPRLDQWVRGIRNIWPDHDNIRIVTNGTYLKPFIKEIKDYIELGVIIEISVHDPVYWDSMLEDAEKILEGLEYFKKTRLGVLEVTKTKTYSEKIVEYFDKNDKCLIKIVEAYEFLPSAIQRIENSKIFMHVSDPLLAHETCDIKDCKYFVNGFFYKCVTHAVAGLLKEQFSIDENSQVIIGSTKGIDPLQDDDTVFELLDRLDNHITECSLCPENPLSKIEKIYPLSKSKIRF